MLTAHITFAVGWLGVVAGFLALAVAWLTSHDVQRVRAAVLATPFMRPLYWLRLDYAALRG